METLTGLVTLLITLSIASERLVDIIKNSIKWLNTKKTDEKIEGWRKSILQLLAVISGIITALLAGPALLDVLPETLNTSSGLIALGLLASGGSGFWNSILTYLLKVKDIKGEELREKVEKRQR